jgi:hypothetical protein
MRTRDLPPPTPINRGDVLLLGISAGITGGLIGGVMLGVGLDFVANGVNVGWVLLTIGAPTSAIVGWVMARRLARRTGLR